MKKYLVFCLFVLSANVNASLINSYDFNGNLSDTLGNGVDLVASGGTVSAGRYDFSNNQGLRLTSALSSTTDYAIEVRMRVNDSVSGFNKVIDFQDLASDIGLYILDGTVDFFTAGPVAGNITLNSDFTLGLARAGGSISIFLDNALLFSSVDSGQAISASNILNFFEDDFATGQRESFIGSADFIRIHNDSSTFGSNPNPVPAPAALWLLGSGLIGLIGMRKNH